MRVRTAGAAARLVLVVILMAGTVISGVPSSGTTIGVPSNAAAVKAKTRDQDKQPGKDDGKSKNNNNKNKTKSNKNSNGEKAGKGDKKNDANRDGNDKSKGKGKGQGKGKHRRGKRPPAPLDAERISAEKADSVEALECGDLMTLRVDGRVYCTHGEDPEPPGADTASGDDEIGAESAESASGPVARALCLDDGVSGPRVQMVYVRRNDRPNRLNELLPTFRRLASEMDTIFDQSAHKTGGSLRVRYVTDANCKVDVKQLTVPPRALDGFGSLIEKMQEAGHNALDRKYLMMVDASVFCGVGTYAGGSNADDPDTEAHDFTGYARVDLPCWDAGSMAHEVSHTFGAVQNSAPHTSRGGHCIDEWDVMCYSDEPFKPKMKTLCKEGSQDFRLDCGNDDYFAASPAQGSYLDRHWNAADSQYLTIGKEQTCVDAALEPDDAFWYDYWKVPMPEFPLGERQNRAFCDEPGDTDWTLIRAKKGTTYLIETTDLAAGVDTQLVLYRGFEEQRWDGMDEFAVNDDRIDGDPSSTITFTAPADDTFLVGIAEASERAGLDRTYTLSIDKVGGTNASPALSLSRDSAKPGGEFTATVRGLTPDSTVTIWRHRNGQSTKFGNATAGGDGMATATFTLPKGLAKGTYQIEAIADQGSIATATLRVVESHDGKDNGKGKGKGGKNRKSHRGGKGKR